MGVVIPPQRYLVRVRVRAVVVRVRVVVVMVRVVVVRVGVSVRVRVTLTLGVEGLHCNELRTPLRRMRTHKDTICIST